MKGFARLELLCVAIGLPWFLFAQDSAPHSYSPPSGFVPDSVTAVRIAIAVWAPIYGEQQIRGEQPYRASLRDGIWTVEGSLPENFIGGVAVAEIAKRDGRIVRVSHGK
jgi:NTF2 fold immunity protein of polymorphic toxin system component